MAIQMNCPGCQKSYKFADDKRGKQVRCPDCSQVFRVGKPSAKPAAPGAPRPQAEPDAVSAPARKPTAKKTAPAPQPKRKPAAAPEPRAATGTRKWPVWIFALAAAALLLVLGGGGAVVAGLWYFLSRPTSSPVVAATTPPVQPVDAPAGKPDNPNPPANTSPGNTPSTPTPPAAPSNPPLASTLTKENFDKIDKGMTMEAVTALLGPESNTGRKPPEHDYVSGATTVAVVVVRGQVIGKSNNQGWPVVYPSDVAANPPPTPDKNPPPDKPPPTPKVPITQDLFNQVDKGMTMDQLVALAGKPTGVEDMSRFNNPDVDTRVSWENFVADIGFTVDMVKGKVASKRGYSHGKLWAVVYPSDKGAPPPPSKPAGSLTKANFDKIDKGMGMDDVVALLGQPTATVNLDPAKFQGVDTQLTFISISPNAAATISMFQGKVVKKENPQNWPVVYAGDKPK